MEKALQYTQIRMMQVDQYASDIEEDETVGLSLSWTTLTPGKVTHTVFILCLQETDEKLQILFI